MTGSQVVRRREFRNKLNALLDYVQLFSHGKRPGHELSQRIGEVYRLFDEALLDARIDSEERRP